MSSLELLCHELCNSSISSLEFLYHELCNSSRPDLEFLRHVLCIKQVSSYASTLSIVFSDAMEVKLELNVELFSPSTLSLSSSMSSLELVYSEEEASYSDINSGRTDNLASFCSFYST